MAMNRREFLAVSAAGAAMLRPGMAAFDEAPGRIMATMDASQVGAPIQPMIFGGYMEPATTSVWAEMLVDRKFANPVIAEPPAAPANPLFRRFFFGEPFRAVGPAGAVQMDATRPFVGQHSPRIQLDGAEARGIRQGKLRVAAGKKYVGRIHLAGDAGAQVRVRLAWGPGGGDSQTLTMPALSGEFREVRLEFRAGGDSQEARLEVLGTGRGAFRVGAVSLMDADNVEGFHPGMIRLFKEVGFKMLKWPGGNFVSTYDWRDGLGDRDRRPPRLEPMWSNRIESNDVGLHEFIALCRLIGAEPDLAINSGFGSAREAAEETEYCNGDTSTRMGKMRAENGHPEPFRVRYWTIGNEMYGPWQYGHMALDQYWVKHNYIVAAMRKVDPTIRVTLSGASICEKSVDGAEKKGNFFPDIWEPPITVDLPYEFGSLDDWDHWLLAKCSDSINQVSEHTYAYPDLRFDRTAQRFVDAADDPLEFKTRRLANRIGGAFDAWDKYVEKMPWLKEKDYKFIFDEWGNRPRTASGRFRPLPGMLVPLSYALCLHEMFRHSGMIAASCATGGLRLLTGPTGDAVGLPAEAVVMKLIQNHFGEARPIAVTGNAPQELVPGTAFVDRGTTPTGSATFPLDILAAVSGDGRSLLVSVVNPTEASQTFSARIEGIRLAGGGKLYRVAPTSVNAANEPGKPPEVAIEETEVAEVPKTVLVPPVSISLYEFEVA